MRYWDELSRIEDRGGFEIIVDKSWEDIDVGDCFDDTCYDIPAMRAQINDGRLDWFVLRVRAIISGHELGSACLGGCLYEDAREVFEDGTAEDLIEQAVMEARNQVYPLLRRLLAINQRLENPQLV